MFGLVPLRNNRLSTFGETFDDFITRFFNDDFFSSASSFVGEFRANLKETENGYLLEAELPGVNKEDINVEYKDNHLVISAIRNEVLEDKKDNYFKKERHYGSFSRSYYVGHIDKNLVNANFENGVLKLEIPKENIITDDSKIYIK